MASGFEVVGLALAVFPILVEGLRFYMEKKGRVRDFIRYRPVLKRIIRDLSREQISFRSTKTTSHVYSKTIAAGPASNAATKVSGHNGPKQRSQSTGYSMRRGFGKLLIHDVTLPLSPPPPAAPQHTSTRSRYHLHVRQQPVAACDCDFDPKSQEERNALQDPRLTVGCFLSPFPDSSLWTHDRDQREEIQEQGNGALADTGVALSTPLLVGKAFMSPFFVDTDPDPESAPTHPILSSTARHSSHPYPQDSERGQLPQPNCTSLLHQPGTFFIFADLSIPSAGDYRLNFRLMNWEAVEDTGQSMPILAETWSDPFRVYLARDFPGMLDSSVLVDDDRARVCGVQGQRNRKGKGEAEVMNWSNIVSVIYPKKAFHFNNPYVALRR
ncbi:Velvet factor [Penicillium sp. IBT 31633x]|nr:Velvet factor [Penicillium sp. IBT 31633x]